LPNRFPATRGLLAIRENDCVACVRWLALTLAAAVGYLAVKYFEFQWNLGVEAMALYWHATDLAWIVIFPLVYVLAGRPKGSVSGDPAA
jgi:heme/copper-type cytochrome/quinol oxidase subunit 3